MVHQNESLDGTLKARKEQPLESIPENQDEDVSLEFRQLDKDGISTASPLDKPSEKSPLGAAAVLPTFKDQVRTEEQIPQQQQIPSVPRVPEASSTSEVDPAVTTTQAEAIPQRHRTDLLQHMIDAKNTIGSDLERGTIDANSSNGSVVEEPESANTRTDRRKKKIWVIILLVTIAAMVGAVVALMLLNDDEDEFSSPPSDEEEPSNNATMTQGANLFWKGQSAFLSATNVHLTFDDGAKWEYSFADDIGRPVTISTAGTKGYTINRKQKWEEGGKERRLHFYFSFPQNRDGNRLIESRAYDGNEQWVYSYMPSSNIWMPPDSLFHCDFVEFNYGPECSGTSVCSSAKLMAEDFYIGAYLASSYDECALNVFHPCKNNTDGNTVCRVTNGVQTCEQPDGDGPKEGADSRNCFARTFG